MKHYVYLTLLLFVSGWAFAQTNTTLTHTWNVTLKVVDEDGSPVVGANTSVGYFTNSQPTSLHGVTDNNGVFTASYSPETDLNELGFEADKSGFYTTRIGHTLFPPYDPAKWNITQTLMLKNIGKPIPMYAKYIVSITFPVLNKPIGYDLTVGDWAAPYGRGISQDFIFTENHADTNSGYTFTISFPRPGDGIQESVLPDAENGSGLRSHHEAPVDGYQPKHEQTQMPDPNKIYYFRVRTALDHQGNVVSAHYGKIYGDFMQFRYYFNPTPNDRNVEFDTKQNLVGGIESFEQVREP
jgi:hypothetical protein